MIFVSKERTCIKLITIHYFILYNRNVNCFNFYKHSCIIYCSVKKNLFKHFFVRIIRVLLFLFLIRIDFFHNHSVKNLYKSMGVTDLRFNKNVSSLRDL